jgi:hypothetical protein
MNRWIIRGVVAIVMTAIHAALFFTPNILDEPSLLTKSAIVLGCSFLLVTLLDVLFSWTARHAKRRSTAACFICGVLGVLMTLSWWFAVFAIPVELAGIVAGIMTLRRESAGHEQHQRLNIAGLVMNALPLALLLALLAWLAAS